MFPSLLMVNGSSLAHWTVMSVYGTCTLEHVVSIRTVDFSPVENYIVIGSDDGFVTLWKYERV